MTESVLTSPTCNVDRLDFHQTPAAWIVARFTRCELGAYLPIARKTEPGFDIDLALAWCREHGWAVREWPGGARAWRKGVEPVRSARQVKRMEREGLLAIDPEWAEEGYEINLQYDL